MKDKIKRVAQLLFDNAEFIDGHLSKSSHYRTLHVEFMSFSDSERVILRIYDEKATMHDLDGDDIHIDNLKSICTALDHASGEIPTPEPVEIRDSLE